MFLNSASNNNRIFYKAFLIKYYQNAQKNNYKETDQ